MSVPLPRPLASLSFASLYFLMLGSMVLAWGCKPASEPAVPAQAPSAAAAGTVTIVLELVDETKSYEIADVPAGSTVESVMRSFTDVPVQISGSGVTAFVHTIDGRSVAGHAGWTYTVNGEFANEGIGTMELTPPATITWTYGEAF